MAGRVSSLTGVRDGAGRAGVDSRAPGSDTLLWTLLTARHLVCYEPRRFLGFLFFSEPLDVLSCHLSPRRAAPPRVGAFPLRQVRAHPSGYALPGDPRLRLPPHPRLGARCSVSAADPDVPVILEVGCADCARLCRFNSSRLGPELKLVIAVGILI